MNLKIYKILIAGLLVYMMCDENNISGDWLSVIDKHLRAYPEMQAADLYKMIYQGMLGPGHLGADRDIVVRYINEEVSALQPEPNTSLIETISPDSHFVRINLKKWLVSDYSSELLADAILRSSTDARYSKQDFINLWSQIEDLVQKGKLSINREMFMDFNRYVIENNYPVIHHSGNYMDRYSPAYRVVSLNVWKDLKAESK